MSTLPIAFAPPSHPRFALADRVARAFPPLAVVRGFRYFYRKRVDLVIVSDGAIDADVKGKRVLKVRLRSAEGRLAAACTCRAKVLGPAACRHVWATLLEIDRRGLLESLRRTQRTLALSTVDETGAACKKGRTTARRPRET